MFEEFLLFGENDFYLSGRRDSQQQHYTRDELFTVLLLSPDSLMVAGGP